jgi:hypothetical protein
MSGPSCKACQHGARFSDEVDGCMHPRVAYQGVKRMVGVEVDACRMQPNKCGPTGAWFVAGLSVTSQRSETQQPQEQR